MILANGCNITKSEKFKGSEYFPYPLYIAIWKKNYQTILISICKKKINDWGDFIGE